MMASVPGSGTLDRSAAVPPLRMAAISASERYSLKKNTLSMMPSKPSPKLGFLPMNVSVQPDGPVVSAAVAELASTSIFTVVPL